MKDYYQILGIKKEASAEEIRRAYHRLAHQHHPDKGGDSQKFKEINEAYQVLSTKEENPVRPLRPGFRRRPTARRPARLGL